MATHELVSGAPTIIVTTTNVMLRLTSIQIIFCISPGPEGFSIGIDSSIQPPFRQCAPVFPVPTLVVQPLGPIVHWFHWHWSHWQCLTFTALLRSFAFCIGNMVGNGPYKLVPEETHHSQEPMHTDPRRTSLVVNARWGKVLLLQRHACAFPLLKTGHHERS